MAGRNAGNYALLRPLILNAPPQPPFLPPLPSSDEAERRKRNLREDARIKVAEGNAAASAGNINAAGSLLVGGSQIASRWLRQG